MRQVDESKRESLKLLSVATAATAISVISPAFAKLEAQAAGISVRVYDNPIGHTVLLQNHSDVTRTIEAIQPFKVFTKDSAVDLKKLFLDGAVRIPARTTQAFFISEDGEVSRHARWQVISDKQDITYAIARVQPVDVTANVTDNPAHSRTRQHLALFS